MKRINPQEMRPVDVKVAQAICRAHGHYKWRYLKDVKGNPSTAFAFYEYLKMGRAAVVTVEKLYAGGAIALRIKEDNQ